MSYADWRERFAEAIDLSRYPLEWLDARVANGSALFWECGDAAILAEVVRFPSGLVELHGLVAAGDLGAIAGQLIPEAERWAARAGCAATQIISRPGWQRVLKDRGYDLHQVALRKEI